MKKWILNAELQEFTKNKEDEIMERISSMWSFLNSSITWCLTFRLKKEIVKMFYISYVLSLQKTTPKK